MAQRWAQVLGLSEPQPMGDGRYRLKLDVGELRFAAIADNRGEGPTTFDVQADHGQAPRELACCGTRIRLVASQGD